MLINVPRKEGYRMNRMRMGFLFWLVVVFIVSLILTEAGIFVSKGEAAERIAVKEAREKLISNQALLVCAYDSNDAFNKMRLEDAIPLSEFKEKLSKIEKGEMVIFYCA